MFKERSTQFLGFVRRRAALLPWRRIGIGFAVVVALLVTVAPLRRAAATLLRTSGVRSSVSVNESSVFFIF